MTEIKSAALELGTERIRKLLVQYAVYRAQKNTLTMIGKGKSISHGVAALEYDLAKEINGQAMILIKCR